MDPKKLDALVRKICNKYNYPMPSSLTLSRRLKSTLGRCWKDALVIELNEWMVLHNSMRVIEAILKHEICHLRNCNHGKEFQQAVKVMGSSMYVEELFDDIVYPAKYVYKCPGCKAIKYTTRKFKKERSCAKCGGKKFNKDFELVLVQGE